MKIFGKSGSKTAQDLGDARHTFDWPDQYKGENSGSQAGDRHLLHHRISAAMAWEKSSASQRSAQING